MLAKTIGMVVDHHSGGEHHAGGLTTARFSLATGAR
jgi:hypothetical protein